jgi:hypothetical protein
MPGDPHECREHAKRCLEIAATSPSAITKAKFEELAQTWAGLAADLEFAQRLLEEWGDTKPKKSA